MSQETTKLPAAASELMTAENFALKILNSSLNGLYIYDVELGNNVFVNAEYTNLTGYTLEDLQALDGSQFFSLFHPDDRQRVVDHMEKIINEGGEKLEIEYRFKTKDGRWIWCLSRDCVFAYDEYDSVSQLIGTFFDISERKHSEVGFYESETKFRELFETLTQGVVFQILPDGRIVDANPAAEKLLGLSREELLDRKPKDPSWQMINEDGSAQNVDENPAMVALRTGQIVRDKTVGVYHPQRKEHRWLQVDAIPQFRPDENRPHAACVLFTDITDRKQTEELARQRLAELEDLYRNAPIGLCVLDRDLRFVRINERLAEINGIPAADHIGKTVRELMPDLADKTEAEFNRVLATGEPKLNIEIVGETPAQPNVRRSWLERWLPINDVDGKVIGLSIVVEETTERKRAEQDLLENNQELTEYAYAVTHNLKAPLRAIHNYANFLLEDLGDHLEGEAKKYLQGISQSVKEGSRQIEDLETLYKVKTHKLNKEEFELHELLNEMKALFVVTPDRIMNIAGNNLTFFSERFLLRQILFHLISNGFKYNDSDVKRVDVGWQLTVDDAFEVYVRDNGIGIDPEYHEQIFEIFNRLHTIRKYEGTGIGLAIVRKAARRIGATLRIESKVGEGSKFYIQLPKSILKMREVSSYKRDSAA